MPSRSLNAVHDLAAEQFETLGAPGLVVGIVTADGLAWSQGFGGVAIAGGATPDSRTLSRVASITKTFTATAVLQLRDEGRLGLDDPLSVHIPEFGAVREHRGKRKDVTLRRMLTHYSGLQAETAGLSWGAEAFPTLDEIVQRFPHTTVAIPADSQWKYSNLAFGLLGEVIARVTGVDYATYIQEEITGPLGLESTTLDLTPALSPRLFQGYDAAIPGDERVTVRPAAYRHLNGVRACGQLHSCVEDLSRWLVFQFQEEGGERGGAQILAGRTLAEMHRPQYIERDWSSGQCIGWRVARSGERVYHHHGGGIHGFGSQIEFNVPERAGVVVLANAWPLNGVAPLARALLETYFGGTPAAPSTTEAPQLPDSESVPHGMADFAGRYVAEPGIPVDVDWRDGSLWLTAAESGYSIHAPARFVDAGADLFELMGGRGAGEIAEFARSGDGPVTGFTLGGWWYRRIR